MAAPFQSLNWKGAAKRLSEHYSKVVQFSHFVPSARSASLILGSAS